MYNLTREQAAEKLGVSTRSIDRYVKSWKLRHEKDWKVVMINEKDIEALSSGTTTKQEIISPKEEVVENNFKTTEVRAKSSNENSSKLDFIYDDLKSEIKEKEMKISELTYKLWKMEEITKNSISLIEFKKSQFLLEESKQITQKELDTIVKEKEVLTEKFKDEKNANNILIVITILLFILLAYMWYSKI